MWKLQLENRYIHRVIHNPLYIVPSEHKSVRIAKISILKLEGIVKKISNERRDYESVVDERAYLRLSPEKRLKKELRH